MTRAAGILARLLDSLLPVTSSPTISIRLPQPQSLKEFQDLIGDVNDALARPADVLFGPCITFSNVDHGSTWIDVAIEAAEHPTAIAVAGAVVAGSLRKNILGFLGGLVELYGRVVRMRQRQRMVEEHLRALDMSGAADEAAAKSEKEIDSVTTEEVERLVQLYGADSEHRADAVPAAVQATRVGARLLEQRAEFHARLAGSKSKADAQVDGWPDPGEIKRLVSEPIARLPEHTGQSTPAKLDEGPAPKKPKKPTAP